MRKRVAVFLFVSMIVAKGFSLHSYDLVNLDTLLLELSKAQNLKDTIDVYFKLSSHYVNYDIKKAELYANQVLEKSQNINYNKGVADGYYALARIFHNSHYDVSFNLVQKALGIYQKLNDSINIAKSLNLISIIKGNIGEYESALEYSNQILDISLKISDSTLYAMVLNNIGTYYDDIKDDSIAQSYYLKAAEVNMLTGHKRFLSINYGNLCIAKMQENNLPLAYEYYWKSFRLKEEINDKDGMSWLYEMYARLMEADKKYDSAIFYFHKSLQVCYEFNNKNREEVTLQSLQKFYHNRQQIDSAYYWLLKLNILRDSIYDSEKTKGIILHEISLKHNQEQEMDRLIHQAQVFKLALVITLLAFAVLGTVLVIIILNLRSRRFRIEKHETIKEKENLELELLSKNQEMTTYVMNLVNNNQLAGQVIEKLSSRLDEFLPQNRKYIQDIINELSNNLNKDIWKEFELRFNNVHPEFHHKLLADFPDLTPNELKLCAFLRMNMSSKEISLITYQSVQSIEKARSRLRKKLNLTNTDVSIMYFLAKY
jgi:DNA-binding CsgD family transcriptional regulator